MVDRAILLKNMLVFVVIDILSLTCKLFSFTIPQTFETGKVLDERHKLICLTRLDLPNNLMEVGILQRND